MFVWSQIAVFTPGSIEGDKIWITVVGSRNICGFQALPVRFFHTGTPENELTRTGPHRVLHNSSQTQLDHLVERI